MKKFLLIGMFASVCLLGIVFVYDERPSQRHFGDKCDADKVARVHWDISTIEHGAAALNDIDILGVRPSSDASMLFEEFAKRLSLVVTANGQREIRDIPSIVATRGGDRAELAHVFVTILTRNGIDSEWVQVYSSHQKEPGGKAERLLVYVPAFDLVFDPTLPSAGQNKGSGRAWLYGRPRRHYVYPVGQSDHNCAGFQVREYFGKGVP